MDDKSQETQNEHGSVKVTPKEHVVFSRKCPPVACLTEIKGSRRWCDLHAATLKGNAER